MYINEAEDFHIAKAINSGISLLNEHIPNLKNPLYHINTPHLRNMTSPTHHPTPPPPSLVDVT